MRTINIHEVRTSEAETFSRKDNSVRGYETVAKSKIQVGDMIVIDNYFTKVVENIRRGKYYGHDGIIGTVGELLKLGILEETNNPNMRDYIFITTRGGVYKVDPKEVEITVKAKGAKV